ncbi:TetR/AcrR family transcriptional regulator [Hoyosella altamirensis]|uniref:AcrR family transcriptional regulator n=1 Tax=Hoyosella altamirensis TaxID=616997 RepID=A0A839RHY7_9ACTN|nr:TetR/AcrR family transcriptional regulator [Hoyosella altamirensis]MBB3035848.1 AcrR family transcriptional regulator [Hoyosella altamirensis]
MRKEAQRVVAARPTVEILRRNEICARILDAAEECLMQSGFRSRVHAAIAQRAGLSRPTVYKYFGDQTAIIEALFEREVNRFLAHLRPVLDGTHHAKARLVESVVFIVSYARQHELLQKSLKEDPQVVMQLLSSRGGGLIERVAQYMSPYYKRTPDAQGPDETALVPVAEWLYRVVTSLITTPGVVDTESPEKLRDFVTELLELPTLGQAEKTEVVRASATV